MPRNVPTFRKPGDAPRDRRAEYKRRRRDHPDQKFLQTREWRDRLRPAQLRDEPLCRHCRELGIVELATSVDHIVVPNGDKALQRDRGNFQSLCHTCHSRKTRAQAGGEG